MPFTLFMSAPNLFTSASPFLGIAFVWQEPHFILESGYFFRKSFWRSIVASAEPATRAAAEASDRTARRVFFMLFCSFRGAI